jgi:hypothetical protein
MRVYDMHTMLISIVGFGTLGHVATELWFSCQGLQSRSSYMCYVIYVVCYSLFVFGCGIFNV